MFRKTGCQAWKVVMMFGALLVALAIGCRPNDETAPMAVDAGSKADTSPETDAPDAITRADADSVNPDTSSPGGWEQVGGGGDRIDQFVQFGDRLYAERIDGKDRPIFRSDDGGETWKPLDSERLDALVASSEYGLDQIEYTRTDTREFLRVIDRLYRKSGEDDWEQVSGRLPGRPGSSSLTSVADRLVYASGTVSNKGFVTTDILFSDDAGESWSVQQEISRGRVEMRSWGERLVVQHGKGLYSWRASSEIWSTHTFEKYIQINNWRRLGNRYVRLVHDALGVSEDGLSWSYHELDDAVPSRLVTSFPADDVLPEQEAPDDALFAIGGDGRIGLLQTDGSWTLLTADSPDLTSLAGAGRPIIPTGNGFVASIYGVPFEWSGSTESWSLLDVSDQPLSPESLAIETNGKISAAAGGQFVIAEPSGWRWKPGASQNSVDQLLATREGLWIFSSTECLYRRPSPSDDFSPIVDWNRQGAKAPSCGEAMPWQYYSRLTDVVHLGETTFLGIDGRTVSLGGHGSPRRPHGGGLYRQSEPGGSWELLGSDSLPLGDDDEPWVSDMAVYDDALWVRLTRGVDTGLFRSEDGGDSWQQVSHEIVATDGEPLEDPQVFAIEPTTSHMYAGLHTVDNARKIAVRRNEHWEIVDTQPPGRLHSIATISDRLYAATDKGLYTRADGEKTFSRIETLPERAAIEITSNPPALAVQFADGSTWRKVTMAD